MIWWNERLKEIEEVTFWGYIIPLVYFCRCVDQHRTQITMSYCFTFPLKIRIWRWKNVSEHVQYEQYLRSSFFKWLVAIFGTISFSWSRCMYISSVSSQYVCDCSPNINTASLLCEIYSCLQCCGSRQVEVLHFWRLFCGFALAGALRTSWWRSLRGGGDPGWCSAPLRWWGCQKTGRGPGTSGYCCIQSL